MKTKRSRLWMWFALAASLFVGAPALADCESVKGRIVSSVVAAYSDGTPCPSPLLLCTEGRFTGDLAGKFRFFASGLTFYNTIDPNSPPDIAASTGVITLETRKLCKGTLTFADTAAFSGGPDGYVVAIETIAEGSGSCADASGRIRLQGVFLGGCVDCKYVGEVCGVGGDDDDDDDDDEDDDD